MTGHIVDLDAFEARLYGYDARLAGQAELRSMIAELRAAREARKALSILRDDLDANDLFAAAGHRLGGILRRWDGEP